MDPGRDPALASRFLGWLQARREPLPSSATVARLTELQAWDASPGDLAARLAGSEDAAPALTLHSQWLAFRRTLPADWVELSGEAPGVTWVGPDDDLRRSPPPGPVPQLVAGEPPAVARVRRRRAAWHSAMVLGTALLLVVLPLVRSAWSSRLVAADLGDAADLLGSASGHLQWTAARVRVQRSLGERLVRVRTAQRAAVAKSCEGEPSCVARLAHLDSALLAARRVVDLAARESRLAGSHGPPPRVVWPAVLAQEQQDLRARLGNETDPGRRRVLEAEIQALDAELSRP